jgi:CRISPR/Cas system-associated exonuclease Cas4 (RecB family)
VSTFANANPFGFEEKSEPGAWITWLAAPLSDAGSCRLPLHQQSKFVVPKDDSGDAMGSWATTHSGLIELLVQRLQERGRTAEVERSISVVSRSGVEVSGKMDLFSPEQNGESALILDAKTGRRRDSHRAQLLVYQALVAASPEFATTQPPAGGLAYGDASEIRERINIPAAEADPAFKQRLAGLLEMVASDGPAPDPVPGSACRFCRLASLCPSASTGRPRPPVVSDF